MKKQPNTLLILLLVSAVLVALAGGYLKYGMLKPLGIAREESVIAMPFVLMSDDALQFLVEMKQEEQRNAATEPPPTEAPAIPEETLPEETIPETEPEPVFVQLEESWFDDALFIGDSRTVGMKNYYKLGKAQYFTNIGMNIYSVFAQMDKHPIYGHIFLEDLLQRETFGKIYIGIGLNECNYEYEYIEQGFEKLVNMIKQHQPDCKIILQSIMMCSKKTAKGNWYFDQENLGNINAIIKSFADGETVFYIDSNEWIVDEEGYLPADMTHDGIHLYGTGYEEWALWIVEKSGWLGIE
jgi:hypothetical protein